MGEDSEKAGPTIAGGSGAAASDDAFSRWIKNVAGLIGVVGAGVGIFISLQTMQQRSNTDHDTAVLNLKDQETKLTIAREQGADQKAQYDLQWREHEADAGRTAQKQMLDYRNAEAAQLSARRSSEDLQLATLITQAFSTDKGSEGALALLSLYATAPDHFQAIGNALMAKVETTTSSSDIKLAFRVIELGGVDALPFLLEINRSAKQGYDQLAKSNYLQLFFHQVNADVKDQEEPDFGDPDGRKEPLEFLVRTARNALSLITAMSGVPMQGYATALVNGTGSGPLPVSKLPYYKYTYREIPREFEDHAEPTPEMYSRMLLALYAMQQSQASIARVVRAGAVRREPVDLHDCFLAVRIQPKLRMTISSVDGAYLGDGVRLEENLPFVADAESNLSGAVTTAAGTAPAFTEFHPVALRKAGLESKKLD